MRASDLGSWGRYPDHPQTAHPLHWPDELAAVLQRVVSAHGSTLAHGRGRSYGDVCLAASNHVVATRGLDRLRAADWNAGTVLAEAGMSLGELLAVSIPRGWFPCVTPGTRHVSLGGAVANDVHGKNHHVRGCFGRHVRRLGLVRTDAGRLQCSAQDNPDLFRATVGGLGLTGLIEWVELQLLPIRSSRIDALSIRFGSLDEFLQISTELDPAHEFSVSWVDCTRGGADLGRGIYTAGDFASSGPLEVDASARLRVPVAPPFSLVNRASLKAFNLLYWHRHAAGTVRRSVPCTSFFYPLDGVEDWNRLYGTRGFQQYQCVIPEAQAGAALKELLRCVAQSKTGSFLAVVKRCGTLGSPGLLSFPLPGVTLAIDFAQGMHPGHRLFPRLDAIVRDAGGRLYPAKDAHMSAADFQRAYPAWPQVEALRDPGLLSHFWQRVTG